MPLSYLRRPLFLLAAGYILALAWLSSRGAFRVRVPRELWPYTRLPAVELEAVALSGFAPKRRGDRFWLRTLSVQGTPARLRLLAYLPRDDPETECVRPGVRLRLAGRLRWPRRPRNPGEFDEGAFLDSRGAGLVFHARRVTVARERAPLLWRPWVAAESARRSLAAYLEGRFSAEESALLQGFLLGEQGRLTRRLSRAIRDAGATHLLVPSGGNVAFLAGVSFALALWLGLPRGLGRAAACAAVLFYGFLVGADPPYLRACLAALIWAASRLAGRESGGFSAWTVAALATLLWEPRSLFSPGFAMSYLAVLALLIALPRWQLPRRWPRALRWAAMPLLASLAVQIMLWPLLALFFGRGSVVGLFANVLLVPVSGLILGAGLCAWGVSWLPWSGLELAAVLATRLLLGWFRGVCELFSTLPCAALDLAPWPPTWVAAYYLAALGVLALPQRRAALRAFGAAFFLGVLALAAQGLGPRRVSVIWLAEEGGRAALVRAPDGRHFLVDAGVRFATLRSALRARRVSRLEGVWALTADSSGARSLDKLRRWGPVGPVRVLPGAALLLSFGRLRVRFTAAGARLWLEGGGAESEYCIIPSPSIFSDGACPLGRVLSTRREGAIGVFSDGQALEIESRETRAPLRGALL